MRNRFFETAFTPGVRAEQARHGSRASYARLDGSSGGDAVGGALTELEAQFITARDSFYLATVSETGWPHVQHRGGPPGFVRVLDNGALAWPDFSGNRQYVSIGNARSNDRAALIFMDYPGRRRLKLYGHLQVFEAADRPDLATLEASKGYGARIEHYLSLEVVAFDWNCPRHIAPRFTLGEIDAATAPLRTRISDLEAQLAAALAGRREA
jgi:predicted pyridoxine 5'-phosphate oxidase superfamily flavin-nucleotide-binding protein